MLHQVSPARAAEEEVWIVADISQGGSLLHLKTWSDQKTRGFLGQALCLWVDRQGCKQWVRTGPPWSCLPQIWGGSWCIQVLWGDRPKLARKRYRWWPSVTRRRSGQGWILAKNHQRYKGEHFYEYLSVQHQDQRLRCCRVSSWRGPNIGTK